MSEVSLALLAAVLIGAASIARPGAVLRERKRYKIDFMSKQYVLLLAVQELTKMTTVGQKVETLNDKRLLICLISLNPYHLFHEFLRWVHIWILICSLTVTGKTLLRYPRNLS